MLPSFLVCFCYFCSKIRLLGNKTVLEAGGVCQCVLFAIGNEA